MSILNFDGPSGRNFGKPLKVVLGIGALAAVVAVASTLAANININSGPVEFGQGVAQTTACDDSITVTPRSQFINTANSETSTTQSVQVGAISPNEFVVLPQYGNLFYPGMQFALTYPGGLGQIDLVVAEVEPIDLLSFSESSTVYEFYDFLDGYSQGIRVMVDEEIFDDITIATANVGGSGFQFSGVDVSDIDATEGNCLGKTFTLKAYGDTETAVLATYSVFVGENGFLSGDGSIESSNAGTSSSSFSLEFGSTRISASSVYKITIESSDYGQSFLDGRTINWTHAGVSGLVFGESIPLAQCSNGVCTVNYVRFDRLDGIAPSQFVFNSNPSGTADKKWTITTDVDSDPYTVYGYIKYFNGIYGVFQETADMSGDILPENQSQYVFSTGGALPLLGDPSDPTVYGGTLTWSYPSESRYTE